MVLVGVRYSKNQEIGKNHILLYRDIHSPLSAGQTCKLQCFFPPGRILLLIVFLFWPPAVLFPLDPILLNFEN